MARRPAIEADELFETANQLQADGKEVTAVALLDALGGGSLRTIYKYLEDWKHRRPAVVVTAAEEIPAGVQSAFVSAWRLATQEAGRSVLAVKEKAAEDVDAALSQFHSALEAIEKLEKESEADAQQIDSFKERVAELESALHKSQTDGAGYKATAEQLQNQVKSQEASIDRLHAAVQQLEKEKADAHSRREEAQRQLEKVEEASKTDRAERDAAIKDAAELRGLSEGLKAQNAELLSRLGRDDKPDRSRKG